MSVKWVLEAEMVLEKMWPELEKGQRTSVLVSGSWSYSKDFKALSWTVSHLTSEETCLTTYSNRPEERERERVSAREGKSTFLHFLHFKATSTDVRPSDFQPPQTLPPLAAHHPTLPPP